MAEFKEEELALMGPGFVLTYMDDPLRRQLIRQVTFFWRQGWGRGAFSRDVPGRGSVFFVIFYFFVWNTYNFV